jgi:hypothetical protein
MRPVTITDINAVLGVMFGLAGFILGLLSYLRDKSMIRVTLRWGIRILNDPNREPTSEVGVVSVVNVGRRPIYLSHVALMLPRKFHWNYMLLRNEWFRWHKAI